MPLLNASEPREIHLWCIFSRVISSESRPRRYGNSLDNRNRLSELHFYFVHDRHRYVMTGASVRTPWSRRTDAAPEKLTFTSNRRGRPEISIGDSAAVASAGVSAVREVRERRRCLECWMLKASYMKVKGGGFSIPLDNFSFYLADPGRFWQFSLGSRHLVAADGEPAEVEVPPRLVLREVVPLAAAERTPKAHFFT